MRVGALVRSYGITTYLKLVIRSYDWVDRLVVLNYRFKGVDPRGDDTQKILDELKQKNVEYSTGEDFNQHEVLNVGMDLLSDCDYIFIADSDEFLLRADQEKILNGIGDYDAGICNIIDYKGDINNAVPLRDHKPIVCAKNTLRFYDVRCYWGRAKEFKDIYLHHLGYVNQYDDIVWKLNWEKKWEHDAVSRLYNQGTVPVTPPQELIECLKA